MKSTMGNKIQEKRKIKITKKRKASLIMKSNMRNKNQAKRKIKTIKK